ncbi:hypothetical protein [Microbacterium sp. zg-YB36]|uniref:hypothetical protein n=1 Tax=Microbacterium sp. zg-YB36 TaxID=2969407 RepID=UPI00214B4EFC|nr:hypothetical protein [Microbacterium sp. zg-YB36]MDL5351134.1 hypothetical protein [Microbacterium sp. zg-YB36]
MTTLIPSQVKDALALMEGLTKIIEEMDDETEWGSGLRLILPEAIPLKADDNSSSEPVAWLVANDFNGYDLSTVKPA